MKVLAVVLSVAVAVMVVVAAAEEAPVVATEEGRISGILERSTKDLPFYSYYGIPFAKPPLGPLRFKVEHQQNRCCSRGYVGLISLLDDHVLL